MSSLPTYYAYSAYAAQPHTPLETHRSLSPPLVPPALPVYCPGEAVPFRATAMSLGLAPQSDVRTTQWLSPPTTALAQENLSRPQMYTHEEATRGGQEELSRYPYHPSEYNPAATRMAGNGGHVDDTQLERVLSNDSAASAYIDSDLNPLTPEPPSRPAPYHIHHYDAEQDDQRWAYTYDLPISDSAAVSASPASAQRGYDSVFSWSSPSEHLKRRPVYTTLGAHSAPSPLVARLLPQSPAIPFARPIFPYAHTHPSQAYQSRWPHPQDQSPLARGHQRYAEAESDGSWREALEEALSAEEEEAKVKGKRHGCPVCKKGFNRPSSLATHMNTHTGAKPYICSHPSCGRLFSVKSNLKRHVRQLHGPLSWPSFPEGGIEQDNLQDVHPIQSRSGFANLDQSATSDLQLKSEAQDVLDSPSDVILPFARLPRSTPLPASPSDHLGQGARSLTYRPGMVSTGWTSAAAVAGSLPSAANFAAIPLHPPEWLFDEQALDRARRTNRWSARTSPY